MSKITLELEKARAQLIALEARKAQEEALLVGVTDNMKELAAALHAMFCTKDHPLSCPWGTDPSDHDPLQADWTQSAHKEWLGIAKLGVTKMQEIGFEVVDPDEAP